MSDPGIGSGRTAPDDGGRDSGEGCRRADSRGRPSSSPSPLIDPSVAAAANAKYHQNNISSYNDFNHHSLLGRHHGHHHQQQNDDETNDKDEPLSDNDDFDDKNGKAELNYVSLYVIYQVIR